MKKAELKLSYKEENLHLKAIVLSEKKIICFWNFKAPFSFPDSYLTLKKHKLTAPPLRWHPPCRASMQGYSAIWQIRSG